MHMIDLPDDCIISFIPWLTLADVIRLRGTCRRLAQATRLYTIWHMFYRRFAKSIPMLPILYPSTLPTLPAGDLEFICTFAYRLHINWSRALPNPTRMYKVPSPKQLDDIFDRRSQIHLLPGGQWLVLITAQWNVVVWDLISGRPYIVLRGREKTQWCASAGTGTNQSGLDITSSKAIWSPDLKYIVVFARATMPVLDKSDHIEHFVLVMRVQVPAESNNRSCHPDAMVKEPAAETCTVPRVCTVGRISTNCFEGRISALDVNGNLLSYYVYERGEIYIHDWTNDSTSGSESRGIVLHSPLIDDMPPNAKVWTRILMAQERSYVLCLNSAGVVYVFLVPPLTVATPESLARVPVVPVSQCTLPTAEIQYVCSWNTSAFDINTYNLHILTLSCHFTLHFRPFAGSYSPSRLTVSRNALPIPPGYRISLPILGPSGTRGVYVETSQQELALFTGRLPSTGINAELPDYSPAIRRVLGGIRPGYSRVSHGLGRGNIEDLVFDECSGRICFRRTENMSSNESGTAFTVVDFAPLPMDKKPLQENR